MPINNSREPPPATREGTRVSDEAGFSLVMSLWLMALLGIVGGLFAYESLQRTRMTDALVRRENAHTMARAGVEIWMGQLRADTAPANDYDAQTENWGWGGQLKNGVTMGDTLYVPSGSPSYQTGDIGFVAIEKIQDETGKHNLDEPLGTTGDTATKIMDNLPVDGLSNALDQPDTFWVSPGDVVYMSGIGSANYQDSLKVVSPYRSGGKINVNTAHPDAMKGLIIRKRSDADTENCYEGSCDFFLGKGGEDGDEENLEQLITAIMERRSGASLSGPNYEEEREALKKGGDEFENLGEVCTTIENETAGKEGDQDFQCNTFKKYIRLDSEGVFRVVVRGGSVDASGEVLNQTTLEAYVDRSQDPMQLISLRSP